MSEFMFLRLRLSEGINKNEFKMQFKKDIEEVFAEPISKHIQLGTMAYKNENYYLTDYGIDISNSVLCDFL